MTGAEFTSADTVAGGDGEDTLALADDSVTLLDAVFENITNFETFSVGGGTNSITLGTKAAAAFSSSFNGGAGNDTINGSAFTGSLTIATGSGGNDEIVLGTAAGQINIDDASNQWTNNDTLTGGGGSDVIQLVGNSQTVTDEFY